jgi:hypothetical protein
MASTPIIDALTELQGALRTALYSITSSRKEVLEVALQDKLNAQFGDTSASVQCIKDITEGLKKFRLR